MDISGPPQNWVKVQEEDFEAYLKVCADYTTERYSWKVYSFRHNGERFAYVGEPGIWVNPKLLA